MLWRLVILDENLDKYGIKGTFQRAYLSTHLFLNYLRHAKKARNFDFSALKLNKFKLHLLLEDINRTCKRFTSRPINTPSGLLRALAAIEQNHCWDFVNLPEGWENSLSLSNNNLLNLKNFQKKWQPWEEKAWQVWQKWQAIYGGEALWYLELAALNQLISKKKPAIPVQTRLFPQQPKKF